MNKGEKAFKSALLIIAATICGFVAGALTGGMAGLAILLVMRPRIDFVLSSFAVFTGATTGLMWGSPIGFLSGLIYSFPQVRHHYWLIASSGAIIGYFCGQNLLMAPFINREIVVWVLVLMSVLAGAACALLVALVLQRLTKESSDS